MSNKEKFKGWHSRGYLQHRDEPGARQFLTIRLADSLPLKVVEEIREQSEGEEDSRFRSHAALDRGYGECWLRREECAAIVEENLHHWDGVNYRLGEYVVMPNHGHVDFKQLVPMRRITHSMKSYTATRANLLLDRVGEPFWQVDYFDRVIRDRRHHHAVERYIWLNPVRAGLCDDPLEWPFSSIHRHSELYRDEIWKWFKRWKRDFENCLR